MEPLPITRVIAQTDLDHCPIGFLFRGKNPDWSDEERCFAGLEAPLNHRHWSPETYLYLIEDEEGRALENIAKSEALIVTKDRYLGDCQVEARVRQFIPGSHSNMDDEYCTAARNGVIFRMQDLRRYYQFCLEGYERVMLYRRCDYDRKVLGLFAGLPLAERNPGVCYPVDVCGDARDELALQWKGELYVYTQEEPFAGPRIFAPQRNERIMYPAISFEGWVANS